MVALNQQFAALATFCSLAAVSFFPLAANAAAIQGRLPSAHIGSDKPVHHHSPIAPFPGVKHMKGPYKKSKSNSRKGKQHKARTPDLSPISSVIRIADMTLDAAKHYYHGVSTDKRHQTQAHFRQARDAGAHVSRHNHPQRQSSIAIPSNRGGAFIVSPGKRSLYVGPGNLMKREDQPKGVSGRVAIMSEASNSTPIAFLRMMESSPNNTWTLNASDHDSTSMYLVNSPPGSSRFVMPSGEGSEVPVSLQVPLFDPSQPGMVDYCATTTSKAASAEPQALTMEKCMDAAQEMTRELSTEQKSQMFAYNGKTGAIRPMWFTGQDDGSDNFDPATPGSADAAGVTNVIDGRDGTGEPASAKNVTLVFVPDAPKVASVEEDNTTATWTMTTTITVTSTSINTPSPSASAADVNPTSASEASLTSSSIPSSSAMVSSTTESSMPLSTPVASAAALNVQVVGLNSTSSSDPAVASTAVVSDSAAQDVSSSSLVSTMTVTSGSTAPTTSINAAEIAESIAASRTTSLADPVSTATDEITASTPVPTAAAVDSTSISQLETASSSAPTITARAISNAPYQWMRAESRL